MSTKQKIVSHIRGHMEQAGFSVQGLAGETGLSPQTIMRARGPMIARCTLETLTTIAGALGVKMKELFEETD